MAVHEFSANHRESPTYMRVYGTVNDNGDYTVNFESGFPDNLSYFNYTWKVYVNGTCVIDIPENTIGNNTGFFRTNSGNCGTHFTCIAYCGCPGCIDNNPGLLVADISLYIPPSGLSLEVTDVTGKTITCKPTWTSGSATNTASVTINGVTKTTTTSGSLLQFTGLSNNTNYTITCSSSDGTTSLTTANKTKKTYGVSLTNSSKTTKKISVKGTWNQAPPGSDRKLRYNIKKGSTLTVSDTDIANGGTISKSSLEDETTYTVTCWIKDMDDAISSIDIKTKKLTVVNTLATPHQFNIVTKWQIKADGSNDDSNYMKFTTSCKAYLSSDVSKTAKGTTSGVYGTNKTLNSTGLESATTYVIYCQVTDGTNKASATVTITTLYPYARIWVNGQWKKAEVYIHNGTTWKRVKGHVYNGTAYKEFSTE